MKVAKSEVVTKTVDCNGVGGGNIKGGSTEVF